MDDIDVYDSDLVEIAKVYKAIKARQEERTLRDPVALVREIQERFHAIGFVVHVLLRPDYVGLTPTVTPEISLVGRVEPHTFDHDQMAREVRSGLLDLPDPPARG